MLGKYMSLIFILWFTSHTQSGIERATVVLWPFIKMRRFYVHVQLGTNKRRMNSNEQSAFPRTENNYIRFEYFHHFICIMRPPIMYTDCYNTTVLIYALNTFSNIYSIRCSTDASAFFIHTFGIRTSNVFPDRWKKQDKWKGSKEKKICANTAEAWEEKKQS